MEGGPPSFPQDCTCLVVLRILAQLNNRPLRDSHPLWWGLPTPSRSPDTIVASPTTPAVPKNRWFGLFPSRSPLLRESRLISFRRATEMFQFAHVPLPCLWVRQGVSRHHSRGVASFGISGLSACMQLPLNVSPVSASFIGLQRQGIHLVLCRACSLHSFISVRGVLWQSLFQQFCWTDLLRFLCFSLALGKIEVIMFLFGF